MFCWNFGIVMMCIGLLGIVIRFLLIRNWWVCFKVVVVLVMMVLCLGCWV